MIGEHLFEYCFELHPGTQHFIFSFCFECVRQHSVCSFGQGIYDRRYSWLFFPTVSYFEERLSL